MQKAHYTSSRRAWVVRFAAALFLLIAAISALGVVVGMLSPGLSVRCAAATGCARTTDLQGLAPDPARRELAASPAAQAGFAAYVARPAVRAELAAVQLVAGLPFAALMFFVGVALRRLAERGGADLARALPWLRRASICALLMTVATPAANSLRAMALLPGSPSGPMWYFEVDGRRLAVDLMLALAAYAVVWAIDAGSRAQRDVAEFV